MRSLTRKTCAKCAGTFSTYNSGDPYCEGCEFDSWKSGSTPAATYAINRTASVPAVDAEKELADFLSDLTVEVQF